MATTATAAPKPEGKADFSPLFPTFEVGPFTEFNSRNLSTAMRAGTALMKGAANYWSHVGAFVSKRLQCDAEAARSFSACRSGEDAIHAQHEFISQMIRDYANETQSLLSIGAEIAKGVAEPIEARAEEAVHNIETKSKNAQAAE
ncbi:MAG: phasin family protein [Amphiplicatus sp.]